MDGRTYHFEQESVKRSKVVKSGDYKISLRHRDHQLEHLAHYILCRAGLLQAARS